MKKTFISKITLIIVGISLALPNLSTNAKALSFNKLGSSRINAYKTSENYDSIQPDGKLNLTENALNDDETSYPSSIDNSKLNAFPLIGNQGNHGSCASFATIYYSMSHMVNLMEGRSGDVRNHIFSPKFGYNFVNGGTDIGSEFDQNYEFIASNGVVSLEDIPYDDNYLSWPTNADIYKKAQKYSLDSLYTIQLKNVESPSDPKLNPIKNLLINGYILNFAIPYMDYCSYGYISNYPSSVQGTNVHINDKFLKYLDKSKPLTNTVDDGHALTVVGYDDNVWCDLNGNTNVDEGEKGAFKIANSFGASWGNGGFFWMPYDCLNDTSKAVTDPNRYGSAVRNYEFKYLMPLIKESEPKLYAEFTLNTNDRGNTSVTLSAIDKTSNKIIAQFSPYAFNKNGGNYAYDGTSTSCDSNFLVDLTKIKKDITANNLNNYIWRLSVNNSSPASATEIKSFKIVDEVNKKQYFSYIPSTLAIFNDTKYAEINSSYTEPLQINNVTFDKESPMPSSSISPVNITASAEGDSGNYLYTFEAVSSNGTTLIAKDSPSNTVSWTPEAKAEDYIINVTVTDTAANESVSYKKDFKVYDMPSINSVDIEDSNFLFKGIYKKIDLSATGGSGDLKYTLTLKNSDTNEITYILNNSSENSVYWIPDYSSDSLYSLTATVTDSKGNTASKNALTFVLSNEEYIADITNLDYNKVTSDTGILTWDKPQLPSDTDFIYSIYKDDELIAATTDTYYNIPLDYSAHIYKVHASTTAENSCRITSNDESVGVPNKYGSSLCYSSVNCDTSKAVINENITVAFNFSSMYPLTYTASVRSYSSAVPFTIDENKVTFTPEKAGIYIVSITANNGFEDIGYTYSFRVNNN